MSWLPSSDPSCTTDCPEAVEMVIIPRVSDIGGFEVRRALPFRSRRMVGPFIFWDQMGPGEFLSGRGLDVRPHPHIGLSTITYLVEGSIDHKDSLGTDKRILPGDVNLMTAGRGITHSERTGEDVRLNPSRIFGIQSWVAQPKAHEDDQPAFVHAAKADLPTFEDQGVTGRIVLGEFQGVASPVETQWPTLYVDVALEAGSRLTIPATTEERALYATTGEIEIADTRYEPQQMLVLKPGQTVCVQARTPTRLMILGGATMDGPRYILWNFVSSSKERLQEAKRLWQEGGFPSVIGDDGEPIAMTG
ncbi:MAG: pirin family protein [Phycisphaerales bacterium]